MGRQRGHFCIRLLGGLRATVFVSVLWQAHSESVQLPCKLSGGKNQDSVFSPSSEISQQRK